MASKAKTKYQLRVDIYNEINNRLHLLGMREKKDTYTRGRKYVMIWEKNMGAYSDIRIDRHAKHWIYHLSITSENFDTVIDVVREGERIRQEQIKNLQYMQVQVDYEPRVKGTTHYYFANLRCLDGPELLSLICQPSITSVFYDN